MFKKAWFSFKAIPHKYLEYIWHILSVCMVCAIHTLVLVIFNFCKLWKKQSILEELQNMYAAWLFRKITWLHPKGMIYCQTGYTQARYIPGIYHVCYVLLGYAYTMQWSLASQHSCPSALGSLRPGLPSDLILSFSHREAAYARLGPSKVPQPGIDLVNMAAPPLGKAAPSAQPHSKATICLLL
jgi:hypothetical protein